MSEPHVRAEVEAAVAAYLAHREQCNQGEVPWSTVIQFFTDDVEFVDAAWGRHVGRDAVARMMDEAMRGLEGFSYPTDVVAISGDDVLIKWRQVVTGLPGRAEPLEHTAVTILRYAGDGLFSFEEDVINVAAVGRDLLDAGWQPGADFVAPPA